MDARKSPAANQSLHFEIDAMTVLAEHTTNAACWSCGAQCDPGAQFCGSCGRLQPTPPTDYFSFFGLPRRFALDRTALEKRFYQLSRRLHPDLYARASAEEQQWSLEKSSLLNDAWRTLREPLSRTEYLLELEGIRLEEQSRNATDAALANGTAKQQIVPADLLEEVFELNMQLEEMRMAQAAGAADPELQASLQAAAQGFESQMAASEQQLRELWLAWDQAADAGDRAAQDQAQRKMVELLSRRSYIRNLLRDVREALSGQP